MNYPILYSKSKLGQILQWQIEVDPGCFRTHEGIVGGAITTSEWTYCKPTNIDRSNYRDSMSQAYFEADAKVKKKKKLGYSENLEDAGEKSYIEPQRAKKLKDYPETLEGDVSKKIIQRKLNGARFMCSNRKVKSRKGELYVSVPHITEDLEGIYASRPNPFIDGEGYCDGLREHLNEIMSIARTSKPSKLTPEFLARSKEIVELWVYDYYDDEFHKNLKYEFRMAMFREIYGKGICGPSIKVITDYRFKTYAEVISFYNNEMSNGGEGIIIRDPEAPYHHGQTKSVIKLKPDDDDEGVIIDMKLGTGNYGNCAKVVTISWEGKTFDADLIGKGCQKDLPKVWEDRDKWLGKSVTFKYNGLTSDTAAAVPNYAKVDIYNCFNDKSGKGIIED